MKRIQFLALSTLLVTVVSATPMDNKAFANGKQRKAQEGTLPTALDRTDYFLQIANELGWVNSSKSNNLCQGYYKQPNIVGGYLNPSRPEDEPTHITAKGPSEFTEDGASILQKDVVVTQKGRQINADKAYIYRNNKTGQITKIVLVGHVKLREAGKLIVSDQASVTLHPETATFSNSAYHLYSEKGIANTSQPVDVWGTAQQAHRDSQKVITLKKATYSTCRPTSPAWEISGSTISIDKPDNVTKIYNAVLWWRRVPMFYFPYYSVPITRERKTGFLTPQMGYSSTSGFMGASPFYWNLAPNYDYTITPIYMTQRKWQFNNTFRYLTDDSEGDIFLGVLPNDPVFSNFITSSKETYSDSALYDQAFYQPYLNKLDDYHDSRAYFSMENDTEINKNWTSNLYLNYATDPYYFTQLGAGFGNGVNNTSVDQLLNQAGVDYAGDRWQFSALFQGYQTLHQIDKTTEDVYDQYSRLPDLTATSYYPNVLPSTDLFLNGEFVNFSYQSDFDPDKPIGQRLHLRPGLSFPVTYASAYVKPQVWVDTTGYNVEHLQPGLVSSYDRTLPILDVDSGFYFDHPFKWGKTKYIQTIEPRLFYLYTPYQNQDDLPNFDTTLLPFSYQQLFSLNRFTGDDRLENANEVSLGFSTRMIEADSGSALLTGDLGTGYYIEQPKVCLDDGTCVVSNDEHIKPIVADVTYSPTTDWSISGGWAWDPSIEATDNASANVSYEHDNQHLASLGYSFVHQEGMTTVGTTNFSNDSSELTGSLSWGLSQQWSFVSYLAYNLSWHRPDNYYVGLKYDSCCWDVQIISKHTYASTDVNGDGSLANHYNTSYYVEFSLKGLGGVSNGDIGGTLSSIPGYTSTL